MHRVGDDVEPDGLESIDVTAARIVTSPEPEARAVSCVSWDAGSYDALLESAHGFDQATVLSSEQSLAIEWYEPFKQYLVDGIVAGRAFAPGDTVQVQVGDETAEITAPVGAGSFVDAPEDAGSRTAMLFSAACDRITVAGFTIEWESGKVYDCTYERGTGAILGTGDEAVYLVPRGLVDFVEAGGGLDLVEIGCHAQQDVPSLWPDADNSEVLVGWTYSFAGTDVQWR